MSDVMNVSNRYPIQYGSVAHSNQDETQFFMPMELTEGIKLNPIQLGIRIGETFTTRTEPLEKLAKNTHRILEIGSKINVWTSTALDSLATNLKTVVDVLDSIRLIGMIYLFFCPQKNGKYFLFDERNTIYKKIDRGFLIWPFNLQNGSYIKQMAFHRFRQGRQSEDRKFLSWCFPFHYGYINVC